MSSDSYSIQRIGLVNVSSYLIYQQNAAILVDCGNRGSEVKILETIEKLGMEADWLKLLVLTHTHFDHAGSAGRLKELTGCKLVVHRSEAERLRSGYSPIPSGTRWKAKLLVGLGRIFARRLMSYPRAEPDIEVDESFDLEPFGFPGRVIHGPGHTPGSMLVLMEGGQLITGDTMFGLEDKQHFPPFAEDLGALVRTWEMIRKLPVKICYPAHGRHFSHDGFIEEYESAIKRYGKASGVRSAG